MNTSSDKDISNENKSSDDDEVLRMESGSTGGGDRQEQRSRRKTVVVVTRHGQLLLWVRGGIDHVGRSFDTTGSAAESWAAAFDTVVRGLLDAGPFTLGDVWKKGKRLPSCPVRQHACVHRKYSLPYFPRMFYGDIPRTNARGPFLLSSNYTVFVAAKLSPVQTTEKTRHNYYCEIIGCVK